MMISGQIFGSFDWFGNLTDKNFVVRLTNSSNGLRSISERSNLATLGVLAAITLASRLSLKTPSGLSRSCND